MVLSDTSKLKAKQYGQNRGCPRPGGWLSPPPWKSCPSWTASSVFSHYPWFGSYQFIGDLWSHSALKTSKQSILDQIFCDPFQSLSLAFGSSSDVADLFALGFFVVVVVVVIVVVFVFLLAASWQFLNKVVMVLALDIIYSPSPGRMSLHCSRRFWQCFTSYTPLKSYQFGWSTSTNH